MQVQTDIAQTNLLTHSGLQYDELMKKYNQIKIHIKSANEKKSKMVEIDAEIERISEQIRLSQIKANSVDLVDNTKQDERILQLERLIEEEDNNRKLIQAGNRAEIDRLQQQLRLKTELLSVDGGENATEATTSTVVYSAQQVVDLQKQIEELQYEVDSLEAENHNLESQYQELHTQTQQKEIQYKQAVESSQQNQLKQKEKTAQIENLQKQLKLLNEQHEILKRTLQTEQLKHSLKVEQNKRKTDDYNRQLQDLEQLKDKLMKEIQIKEKQRALQRDKLINENNKLNQQKQTMDNMDKQYNLLEKHSAELDKNITQLRKKVKDMKEEDKLPKPKKTETNFKLQMNSLQTKIQTLEQEIQRQRKKYNQIIKMKSTYVSQSQLSKLQDEYNKLIVNVKPVEGELKKNERLRQDNKLLKQRVEYLKKADEQAISSKKNLISEIKAKNQNLIEHKQFYEKHIQHNQLKLTQYMKEYPNHEQQKEQRKRAKKHHKQQQLNQQEKVLGAVNVEEETVKVGEVEEVNKAKKRRVRNRGKLSSGGEETEDSGDIVFDENVIPKGDKVSEIYKNKNVQLAILGAILILALLLFSSFNLI